LVYGRKPFAAYIQEPERKVLMVLIWYILFEINVPFVAKAGCLCKKETADLPGPLENDGDPFNGPLSHEGNH
jgi:hypothetical protein